MRLDALTPRRSWVSGLLLTLWACAPSGSAPRSCGNVRGANGRLAYGYIAPPNGPAHPADRALAPGVRARLEVTGRNQPAYRSATDNGQIIRAQSMEFRTRCVTENRLPDGATMTTSEEDAGAGCGASNQRVESTEVLEVEAVAAGETEVISTSTADNSVVDRLRLNVGAASEVLLWQGEPERWISDGELGVENDTRAVVFARMPNGRIVVTAQEIRVSVEDAMIATVRGPGAMMPGAEALVSSGQEIRLATVRTSARTNLRLTFGAIERTIPLVTRGINP